jgi:uncharacterized protein involved in outer membrane biogenesis
MRLLLRIVAGIAVSCAVLLAALVLYLSFGDLNRHKGRIESYVSQRIGRPFAIDGTFALDLFPAVKVEAEHVRIGNAAWGSAPQMVQVGRIATEINLRSLFSGPVDVHSLELRDVTILLEANASGERNWVFGTGAAKPGNDNSPGAITKLPFAFRRASVSNLKAIVRMPGSPERVARIESLTVQPDANGLLALEGSGALDGYVAALKGQAGPLEALLAGRNIRLDLKGGLGNLRFAARGGFARLDPLAGADLKVSVENPDLGTLLKNLRLPAFATGKLDVSATLKEAGTLTALDLTAKTDDLFMHATGMLSVLGLRDSDLSIRAEAADAARLAQVFNIKGVPEAKLAASGRFITKSSGLALDGVHATLGGYEARVDGTIPARRNRARQLRFSVTVPDLAQLQEELPQLPLSVQGEIQFAAAAKKQRGIKETLLSSRDIQLNLTGAMGDSRFTAKGGFARIQPLEGADIALSVNNPDGGTVLERLQLPPIAAGALAINATLKKAGKLTDVDVNASIGDTRVHSTGTLSMLGLRGSDLTIQADVPDAASLAQVFNVKGVPTGKLLVTGRVNTTDTGYTFDKVHAVLGQFSARMDGTLPRQHDEAAQLRFDISIPTLAILKANLPSLTARLSGDLALRPERMEFRNLKASFGASQIEGSVTLTGDKDRQIEADLNAQLLDLTPFLQGQTAGAQPAKKTLLFDEQPLPYEKMGTKRAKVHLTANELRLNRGVFHEVEATLALGNGRLRARLQGRGGFGGSADGSIDLTRVGEGSAAIKVDLTVKDMRTGFASGNVVRQEEVPPVGLHAALTSTGATPHQLASAASGTVLFTQGRGKSKSDLLTRIGGDLIAQLFSKLNPFAEQDPYTEVDCMVARAVVNNGKVNVAPVLLQTRKVAIVASGTIDLKTEKLLLNFNTRPRQGIGISPGMFTNPFLDLTGTLTSPSIGIGGKGVASGAVAVATGGLSVLAKGAMDRAIGETNQCKETLEKAQQPAVFKER